MNPRMPTADDRKLWDLHLSSFATHALTVADELGLFDELARQPSTPEEVARALKINLRAARAVLALLVSTELLIQRAGRYYVTETAQNYLLRSSPYYWGPVLSLMRNLQFTHASVMATVRAPEAASHWTRVEGDAPIDAWSGGSIGPELARDVGAYMNANSLAAAFVLAQRADLSGRQRLLDVGAGSGCFSIALAHANPDLRCTLMDLEAMCAVGMEYVRAAGLERRIDTCPRDMFRQAWPSGYDAILLSNILHDWDFETASLLVGKVYDALSPGGRILIHEMLLDDSRDGPTTAAAFSFYMLVGTKGQQFTAPELSAMLGKVGFKKVDVTPAHGYYALVSAEK
jgi:2-polyprenyl-3-methyl-5-hydroxy-6-metoxy-1,4-benzoquinol methylase